MADDHSLEKRVEQAEYRAQLIEAELNAIRGSKAYQLSKKIGIIKSRIKSDPVGLSKKAAKLILTNPKKARHMLRSADRGAFIAQSVVEQTAKYQEWILLNEPDENELDEQRLAAEKLAYKPVISIVTPVFNPPVDVLEELIESVLEQTYPYFELCLGDFGDKPEVETLLAKYAKLDKRIKHYTFSDNQGIAGNSNQILAKVTGEFIGLLDHDDTLSPDALYENAKLLNEKPYDFIYSDKDKIDEQGNRFDPLFKAELSPEMLLNVNYLTHFNVMRTDLVKSIGGWDPETDGAQDWDLFLRVVSEAKHVGFIPKVLYHWRVIATSTAMSIETKPYALANQCKAVDKYLQRHNIPAHAYIIHTELLLKWDESSLDKNPIVFLHYSNLANTHRIMRRVRKVTDQPNFVLLMRGASTKEADEAAKSTGAEAIAFDGKSESLGKQLDAFLVKHRKAKTALFLLDSLRLTKSDDWYERLAGWLNVPGVTVSSGRLVNRRDLIVSSGGLVNGFQEYFPLFQGYPRYYQSYIGNAEWVRNLSIVSPFYLAAKLDNLRTASLQKYDDDTLFDRYFLSASKDARIVMSPHATAIVNDQRGVEKKRSLPFIKPNYVDPYNNPNLSSADPLRLFADEQLVGITPSGGESHEPVDRYQHDAAILANTFDISAQQIAVNGKAQNKHVRLDNPQSVAWFLPSFDAVYAGLTNIFSFANYLAETKKLKTTFYILTGTGNADTERAQVVEKFAGLAGAEFVPIRPEQLDAIKPHDIGIATQWATTFPLAKAEGFARKCYFIQDNEVNFYPKGTISALVELSYQFDFMALAGTDGLLDMYQQRYSGYGTVLKSKVDLSAYHPRTDRYYTPKKPYKVFFYARPNMPRNAFELGIAGLKKLKEDLGENVEIITAGAPWDVAAYGVQGMFNNLGKIAYEAVPKLYRSVDAGLMFMFSGHPGVTASELMASGCPVVVNEYDDVTWHELYQNEKTCLVTMATASEVARNLKRCLQEPELRKTLIDGGLEKAKHFYEGYEASLEDAYQAIVKGKGA